MATAQLTISVRIRDLKRVRLMLWQLEELRNSLMLVGSPYASDLDRIINDPKDDDDDEDEAPVHQG